MEPQPKKTKFTNVGYVTKAANFKEENPTYHFKFRPKKDGAQELTLTPNTKIIFKQPRKFDSMSQEEFEKMREWKLFEAVLIEEE